jgi:Acetyltransferase (GNAT) domain
VLVKKLDASFHSNYSALCQSKGSIFNSLEWLSLYGEALELYGLFNKDHKLIGGFHLYKTKIGGFLTHYKNPPFTPNIGLFFENQSSNKANSLSYNKSIAAACADFFEQLNYQILTLATPNHFIDTQPFIWKNFKVIPNYTYHIDLLLSEEELLKNLSSDKRNSINKAAKDKVSVELCTDKKQVLQMVEMTYSRKAKALNDKIVKSILFDFATDKNSFAYVAYVDNKPSALSFCIHDNNSAYYLLGGYDTANKHQGAGVLALWQCMLHAKNAGLKKFDLEGSMIPQVEKYFRGFGGDLIPYFTLNKADFLIESLLKFTKRSTF